MTHNIITGGAGMIGSHLADALTARGERVTVVDNFSRGSYSNLAQSLGTGLCRVHIKNLERDRLDIGHDDIVWHLAAKVTSIEYNRHNHYDMLATNLAINHNVVEAVRWGRPRFFCFVSTACVYPHDAPVPTPEWAGNVGDPEPTNHGYGVAKWVGEQMVKHLHKEHNVPCLIVRFFNAFGPRDYYDYETSHVAPALIRRVMEGENPLTVWGSGNQTRALVDSRDIAQALVVLQGKAETWWHGAADKGSALVVNIGHEREVSIRELAETILRLSGKEAALAFDTSKPDGYPRRAADPSRLRDLIGWVPDRDMESTLADMIAEYRAGRAHT